MARKNSMMQLWDTTNFTEEFKIVNLIGEVQFNREDGAIEFNSRNIVFNKTDDQGVVLDTIGDVVSVLNSGAVLIETSERVAADEILQVNIDTEESSRVAAVNTLITDIQTEKVRIDSLLNGTSVNLDTLQEIITAYSNADTTIIASIATLQNQVNTIASLVEALSAAVVVPPPIKYCRWGVIQLNFFIFQNRL